MIISTDNTNLNGYKAFIPGVSFGNLGQLAIDLLISSSEARKIGSIWHEAVLPIVSSDAFDSENINLTISTELYVTENTKSLFIQIRSPMLKKFEDHFKEKIFEWLVTQGIESLIILVSALDIKKYKSQVDDPDAVRFACGPKVASCVLDKLKEFQCLEAVCEELEDLKEDQGTRLAMSFMSKANQIELACVLLLKYCAGEGDNQSHAVSYAVVVDNLYKLLPESETGKHFTVPPSWNLMFGNDPPEDLY